MVRVAPSRCSSSLIWMRAARGGALVDHRRGQLGGARRAAGVGGVAGVDQQVEVDDRHGVALHHHQLQAVGQRGALQGGEPGVGGRPRDRQRAPVDVGGEGLQLLAEGADRQHRDPVGEPALAGLPHLGRRGGARPAGGPLVAGRVAAVDLPLRQHVRLAAEAADPLDAADEGSQPGGAGPPQLVGGRPLGEEAGQLLLDGLLDGGGIAAGPDRGHHGEVGAQLGGPLVGHHVGGQLLVVDQPLEEARALARGQHLGRQVEQRVVLRAPRRRVPDQVEARLRHAVLQLQPLLAAPLGHPGHRPLHRRAGRDVAEVLLDARLHVLRLDVAGHHQGGVGRAVPGLEPLLDVVERGGVEVGHRADDRPGVRVPLGVEDRLQHLVHQAVGLVLSLPLLVLDHAPLQVELLLVDGAHQVAHAVGLDEERGVERRDRDVLEVVGPVLVGGAVEVGGPERLERLDDVALHVLGGLEHQVLEEVGEPGPARLLVLGADVVPDVDGDDGGLVVLVDHQRQPVLEDVAGGGDLGDLLGAGRRGGEDEGEGQRGTDGHRMLLGV